MDDNETVIMQDSSIGIPVTNTPDNPPLPTSGGNNTPKPKSKKGVIVAAIFGILLLIGGIGAGLVLVNQQQILKQKAAGSNCDIIASQPPCKNNNAVGSSCTTTQGASGKCQESAPGNLVCSCIPTTPTGGSGNSGNGGGGANCDIIASQPPCKNNNAIGSSCSVGGTQGSCQEGTKGSLICSCVTSTQITCGSGLSCSGSPLGGAAFPCLQQGTLPVYCCAAGWVNQNGTCVLSSTGEGACGKGSADCINHKPGDTVYVPGVGNCIGQKFLCGAKDTNGDCSESGAGTYNSCTTINPTTSPISSGGGNNSCSSGWCTLQNECTGKGGSWGGQSSYCSQGSLGPVGQCCLGSSGGGGGGGGGGSSAPPQYDCGSPCKSNSDCRPAANGGTSACINGTCQNTQCVGKTIPGANCDCSSLNTCGQHCGASVGLCQAGSVCRYTDSTCSNNQTTQCVPAGPNSVNGVDNLPSGWKTTICPGNTPGNANYYVQANGVTPTYDELQLACSPTVVTPLACTAVGTFDTNWNPLTSTQLSQLAVGATVRFTISTSGADKAMFTINGVQEPETTLKKPNSTDFYFDYIIPAGVTTFNYSAQVHDSVSGNWY